MNFKKLQTMQVKLDEVILKEKAPMTAEERFNKTLVALSVEIAEVANQEADELAYSVWNKLENLSEPKLSEPKFNDNQSLALWAMKNRFKWHSNDIKSGLLEYLTTVSDEVYLSNKEFTQVLQAFTNWALAQC